MKGTTILQVLGPWPRILAAVVLLLAPTSLQSRDSPSVGPQPVRPVRVPESGATERAREYIQELMKKHALPGFSVAVAVDGQMAWSAALGECDLENHSPALTTTRFRIGSVSKLLTAAAVARLRQDGRLDLDAPIQRYVTGLPEGFSAITSRQLAGHLSGIRHYRDTDPIFSGKSYKTLREGVAIFANDPLLFEPGTKYEYSSYGYNLLGVVVEGASGRDFLAYLDEHVLRPLGMARTTADRNDSVIEGRTRFYFYDRKDGRFHNAPYVDSSYKWPSGGFLSTAEDLVRFGLTHCKPGFFTREMLDLLLTPQALPSGEPSGTASFGVGFGWRIGKDARGARILHHGGTIEGGRAFLLVRPEDGVVVALLSNNVGGFGEGEAGEIAAMFGRR